MLFPFPMLHSEPNICDYIKKFGNIETTLLEYLSSTYLLGSAGMFHLIMLSIMPVYWCSM